MDKKQLQEKSNKELRTIVIRYKQGGVSSLKITPYSNSSEVFYGTNTNIIWKYESEKV